MISLCKEKFLCAPVWVAWSVSDVNSPPFGGLQQVLFSWELFQRLSPSYLPHLTCLHPACMCHCLRVRNGQDIRVVITLQRGWASYSDCSETNYTVGTNFRSKSLLLSLRRDFSHNTWMIFKYFKCKENVKVCNRFKSVLDTLLWLESIRMHWGRNACHCPPWR